MRLRHRILRKTLGKKEFRVLMLFFYLAKTTISLLKNQFY